MIMKKVLSFSGCYGIERMSFIPVERELDVFYNSLSNCRPYYLSTDRDVETFRAFCEMVNMAPVVDGKQPVMLTLGESTARLAVSVLKVPVYFLDISSDVNDTTVFQLKCVFESRNQADLESLYFGPTNPLVESGVWDEMDIEHGKKMFSVDVDFESEMPFVSVVDIDLFSKEQVAELFSLLSDRGQYAAGVNLSNLLEYDGFGRFRKSRLRGAFAGKLVPSARVLMSNCSCSWEMAWEDDPIGQFYQISRDKNRELRHVEEAAASALDLSVDAELDTAGWPDSPVGIDCSVIFF